jgi:hypothetical protein
MAGVTPDIVFSSGIMPKVYTTPAMSFEQMGRATDIDNDLALVREIIKFSPSERSAVIGLLHLRQTHRELASRDGLTRSASRKRMSAPVTRARRHGLEIPAPKRPQKRTLSEMRAA